MSVYELTQQNVVAPAPSGLPNEFTQTGEIQSKGFEIEGKLSLNDQLDLLGSYTYTNARVTQSTTNDLGKVPLWIPQNMASVWADYTFRDGNLNGLGFGLGVRYIGETFGNAGNTLLIPAYTLVDAAIHYDLAGLNPQLKGLRFSVNASNLFDKVYVSECTNANCLYGLRRSVLATLRYKW